MKQFYHFPTGNYMFKVNNRNNRTRCEECSKLTIKIPERRYWRRSGIFIVKFEQISQLSHFTTFTFQISQISLLLLNSNRSK